MIPRIALNPTEAAEALGIPRTTFQSIVDRGEIPVIVTGGGSLRRRWVVRVADLEAWAERKASEESDNA